MNKKQEDLLKSINNGKIKGSQKLLAKKLNVSEVAISRWLSGLQNPSQENYEKMAKIFNKKQKEIEKIFSCGQNNIAKNNPDNKMINLIMTENELLKKDIQLIKKDLELIKLKLEKN